MWSRAARAGGSSARGWPGHFRAAAVVVFHSGLEGGTHTGTHREAQREREAHIQVLGTAKHTEGATHFFNSIC